MMAVCGEDCGSFAFAMQGPTREQVARLRARAPRLVYAHFAPDGYAAMQLAEQLGVPLVTALHGYDVTMSDQAMGATRLGREYLQGRSTLQKTGALFLSCSDVCPRARAGDGIPGGPHHRSFDWRGCGAVQAASHARGSGKRSVLFVGRLVEKKGCGSLIEAMVEVQRCCPAAELVVIGDGPLRADYEARAVALGVRCRFLGIQPTAVVRDWMARAAVFCVPSVVAASGDAEGFGMVFIEAQAMGLPVVSTLSGGIPEAVKHGETGLLVAERDPAALAEAILQLMEDEELWQRYSLAGRKHVVNHFNLAQQTGRLENVFEQLLADPDQAGAGTRWGN